MSFDMDPFDLILISRTIIDSLLCSKNPILSPTAKAARNKASSVCNSSISLSASECAKPMEICIRIVGLLVDEVVVILVLVRAHHLDELSHVIGLAALEYISIKSATF